MTQPYDDDANDFLLNSGQGGGRAAKFERIGQLYEGAIVSPPKKTVQTDIATKQPKVSKFSGQPLQQVLVQIQTTLKEAEDDDGIRTLYVKNKMATAVGTAMREAGVSRLEVGGYLQVGYVRDIPSDTPGFRPSKDFLAKYTPPAVKDASDFFAQAAAPVVATTAAPQGFELQHQDKPRVTTLQQLKDASFNAQGQPQNQAPPF